MSGSSMLRLYALCSRHGMMCRPMSTLTVGSTATVKKTITKEKVKEFAEFSDDMNPIHVDEDFAKQTQYGRCIVHGLLTNGLTSGALAKLPGARGAIMLSQEIKFTAPVFVGDTVEAKAEVADITKRLVICKLTCTVVDRNEVAIEGIAKALLAKKQ